MNQKLIIGIIALIVIIGGIGIYSSNNSKPAVVKNDAMVQKESSTIDEEKNNQDMVQKETNTVMVKQETSVTNDEGTMMTKGGSYETYEPSKIIVASTTHDVVLFFRASWCPTCIAVDKDIKANLKAIPERLTILDVDYDNSTELKKKYGVTYQHTFVQVDANGNLIKKWSGSPTLASLVAQVK